MKQRCLCILFALISFIPCHSQEIKRVSGRVLDKTTGKPIDLQQVVVNIYAFNTVAAAQDVKKQMDGDENSIVIPDAETHPDDNGYYDIPVAETGALIFKVEMKEAILEPVNFRMEINVRIEMGNYINTSTVTAVRDAVGVLDPQGEIEGNYLKSRCTISLPANSGKTNARMIVQPMLLDGNTGDTLRYLKPTVMDGLEYRLTQLRMMGYSADNDPLTPYVSIDTLTAESQSVNWADTIYVEDPSRYYQVKGIISMEDYNVTYFEKDHFLASSRLRRPLRFLEYSMAPYHLNPNDYVEKPKREKRDAGGSMSLTFKVGQAVLSDDDTVGIRQIDSVKQALLDIIHGEGSQLKEFHIVGVASPDGSYASNLTLAKRRMEYILGQITSIIPNKNKVFITTKAEVAPWANVADLLEADSLKTEAKAIRDIIQKYPGGQDRQWERIRSLPFYKSVISLYLPKLRTVNYSFKYDLYRELTPEEILDRYHNDEDYRSGRKQFALYEYWHLFNMIKDPLELENLYLRAYKESEMANGKPWVLAACNLAASYIARGVCDTTLLGQFIDLATARTDFQRRRFNGDGYDIVNPEAVVANQMIMYVMDNNFRKAGQLTNILGDNEKNALVTSFALCLGGYYKGGNTSEEKTRARKVFENVSASSPRNKVVLSLAMNTKSYDAMAEEAMAELDPNDPLTDYLWSVIYGRKAARGGDFMDDILSEDYLLSCFQKDKSYIDIAAGDGDIVEYIFKSALDRYNNP